MYYKCNNGNNFRETCITVSVKNDLKLEECIKATCGGQECTCNVYCGWNAVELDCTKYNEHAWIPFQRFTKRGVWLQPFVPHFVGSVDGSNEQLKGACPSEATTKTAVVSATITAVTLVVNFFMASFYVMY